GPGAARPRPRRRQLRAYEYVPRRTAHAGDFPGDRFRQDRAPGSAAGAAGEPDPAPRSRQRRDAAVQLLGIERHGARSAGPAAGPRRAAGCPRHEGVGGRLSLPSETDLLGHQPAALARANRGPNPAAAGDLDARPQLYLRAHQHDAAHASHTPAWAYVPGDRIEQADRHAVL